MLVQLRRTLGEYNFAGQHQEAPTRLGGGMVKAAWFKNYAVYELPDKFDQIVQSWDTANKASRKITKTIDYGFARRHRHATAGV
jgi:hypothetical protein